MRTDSLDVSIEFRRYVFVCRSVETTLSFTAGNWENKYDSSLQDKSASKFKAMAVVQNYLPKTKKTLHSYS